MYSSSNESYLCLEHDDDWESEIDRAVRDFVTHSFATSIVTAIFLYLFGLALSLSYPVRKIIYVARRCKDR